MAIVSYSSTSQLSTRSSEPPPRNSSNGPVSSIRRTSGGTPASWEARSAEWKTIVEPECSTM